MPVPLLFRFTTVKCAARSLLLPLSKALPYTIINAMYPRRQEVSEHFAAPFCTKSKYRFLTGLRQQILML